MLQSESEPSDSLTALPLSETGCCSPETAMASLSESEVSLAEPLLLEESEELESLEEEEEPELLPELNSWIEGPLLLLFGLGYGFWSQHSSALTSPSSSMMPKRLWPRHF